MSERKLFDIVKHVPIVGLAYRAIRGAAYEIAGDKEEALHSVSFNVADLNPLRSVRNITNGVINAFTNVSEGIWLGKRGLRGLPIGISLTPGFDIYHWCIQI